MGEMLYHKIIEIYFVYINIMKPVIRILNIFFPEEAMSLDEMEIARVIPGNKIEDPMTTNHYKPVSIYLHFPNYLSKPCTEDSFTS